MKLFPLVALCSILIPRLTLAGVLRRRATIQSDSTSFATTNSRELLATGRPDLLQRECELVLTEDECWSIENCGWVDSKCIFKVVESCGIIVEQSACESSSNCEWKFDDETDTRPGAKGQCTDKVDIIDNDIVDNDNCAVSESKRACNSVKGCSWIEGEESSYCSVAPTQLSCDVFQDKNACEEVGCLAKKQNRRRNSPLRCLGRWEYKFLVTLRNMDGNEAKQLIEEEFGRESYNVVLVKPGKKQKSRRKDRTRIKLFLNRQGKIKKTPRFG